MPIQFANDANLNGHQIINLAAGTDPDDGINLGQLTAASTADRNRANHTGTQLASTISNFNAAVQTNTLDSLAAPVAPVDMGGQLLENVADAVSSGDAVNLGQLTDAIAGLSSGLVFKGPVRSATSTNITVANPGTSIFDGITVAAGEVVLLTGQSTGSQNGAWTFNGPAVAMTRPANFSDTAANVLVGSFWVVLEGTHDNELALLTNDTFTLGSTTGAFTYLVPGGGGGGTASAYAANAGTGSAGPYVVTHNLGSTDVDVTVRELAGGYNIMVSWTVVDANNVSLEPDETWASASHRVYVESIV